MFNKAFLAALGAILIWSVCATLTVQLAKLAPMFLTGSALVLGGIISLPKIKSWTWDWRYIIIGTLALASYQSLIFFSFRTAPSVEVNLINYLWPLLIVLLAPIFDKETRLKPIHLLGALIGFGGGALAIMNQASISSVTWHLGYLLAFIAAIIWACYSLIIKRLSAVSFWTMGAACIFSGIIALALSQGLGEPIRATPIEILWLALLGFGPLGLSFYFWGYAMKNGNPSTNGTLAYITPVLSTGWLLLTTGRNPDFTLLLALGLVVAGAAIGNRKSK
jgi:drug/metabolite transporter (DMT)-like permease